MTKEKKEELLKALEVIKSVCKETKTCLECPLRCNSEVPKCYIYKRMPNAWATKCEQEEHWRAFYD